MQYDSTNNSTFCHITKPIMIAQQVEKYNGYACSGYVQNYKTIPGNAINPTFSIMQSPGVTMSFMEKVITLLTTIFFESITFFYYKSLDRYF